MTERRIDLSDPNATIWETHNLDDHVSLMARQVRKSLDDPETKALARKLVNGVVDRSANNQHYVMAWGREFRSPGAFRAVDDTCAIMILWNFVCMNVRYVRDPDDFDLFCTVKRTLAAGIGDCFPEGTLLLRDDFELVSVENLQPGDRIWGRDRWSTVGNVWAKGELAFDLLELNNGSKVWLTPEHKVYVAECVRHSNRTAASAPCSCPVEEREIRRVPVSELTEDTVLISPERLPFGAEEMDGDRALVEGLYLSDGFRNHESDFAISGQDGCPKEEQKRLVAGLCEAWGIPTRWHRKYLTVLDKEWSQRLARMGSRAPEKRALSLNLAESAAAGLLRGIMADSGKNTHGNGRTFTTTSRRLATQTRVLHKMFGTTCGASFIENHGGLGKNPIYRLSTRSKGLGKAEKLLRIKHITRNIGVGSAWDISTDDHYVYLPEHDVTVSNCDDYTIVFAALFKAIGWKDVRARVISVDGSRWAHVTTIVSEQRGGGRLVNLDPTVKDSLPGWEFPGAKKKRDFVF